MHVELTFPTGIKVGPSRLSRSGLRTTVTDGGHRVRRQPWSTDLQTYDATIARRNVDHADFAQVLRIWEKTGFGAHSFNLVDWLTGETVRVCFDEGALGIATPTRNPMHEIDVITMHEDRYVSPSVTVIPVITGTVEVGETLTVSDGTWSGSPTSYRRQWLRDGAEIAAATAATYLLALADLGANISCDVIAVDADGGETLATSAETAAVAP